MYATENDSANLRDYLRPVRERWWLIVAIALIAAAATYYHYHGQPRRYSASTQIFLQSGSQLDSILGTSSSSGGDPDRSNRNQAILLQTTPVAAEAAKLLNYKGDSRALLQLITVTPASDSDFLTVTATSSQPQDAIRVANAFAKGYIATRKAKARRQASQALTAAQRRLASLAPGAATSADRASLSDEIQRLQLFKSLPTADAQQVDPAETATVTASSPKRSAVFALALGALLGLLLTYGFEFFDRRIKRFEQIGPAYGRMVLVGVPGAGRSAKRLEVARGLQPPFIEAFRALRTSLQLKATGVTRSNGRPTRTILVTSAVPEEGKSTVARNLALAYHEAGLRVALVDADMRRPQVAARFALTPAAGLAEVLAGEIALEDAIEEVPVEADGGDAMARARERARSDRRGSTTPLAPPPPGVGVGTEVEATTAPSSSSSAPAARLRILPSGHTPSDPVAVLTAGGLATVLQQLSAENDVVIVDSSPLLVVSDAVPLLTAVDGVLLVCRLKLTTTTDVAQLNDLLDRVPDAPVLGVVANDVREPVGSYAYSSRDGARGRRMRAA